MALTRIDGPTGLALTAKTCRSFAPLRPADNPCAHGGYELVAAQGEAKGFRCFASGSEVEIAVAAQKQLSERGIATRGWCPVPLA